MPDALNVARRPLARSASRLTAGLSVGFLVGRPVDNVDASTRCGVRDYAGRLAEALSECGVSARVIAPVDWGLRGAPAFVRALRAERLDILHLQYPSLGHRYSLLPHMLGRARAARRFAVTMHEHSALPLVQQAANLLFRVTADRLIFTTEYEARAFGARAPVIPIGSNVPAHHGALARGDTVLYFGQIRPHKGIETFLALARLVAADGDQARFVVIGSTPLRWRDYERALRAQSPANVDWVQNASFADVAQAMATAAAAYLPFPDGAGLRRGSLLAALSNGLPVIAPFGPSTTDTLRSVLLGAETAKAAFMQLRTLRATPDLAQDCALAGRALAQRFAWPAIAAEHLALYRDMLTGNEVGEMLERAPRATRGQQPGYGPEESHIS